LDLLSAKNLAEIPFPFIYIKKILESLQGNKMGIDRLQLNKGNILQLLESPEQLTKLIVLV